MSKLKNKAQTELSGPFLQQRMAQNNQNSSYLCCFWLFWGMSKWTQKRFTKTHKQAGCMAHCLSLKISPIPNHQAHFFQEKQSKTTGKQVFYTVFCHFGVIWAPSNGPKKVHKGCKWPGCMAQCLSLKISPMPDDQAHYFRRNGLKQPEIVFFMLFFVILELFGHPQMGPKRFPKARKWAGFMAQCLSFNISS